MNDFALRGGTTATLKGTRAKQSALLRGWLELPLLKVVAMKGSKDFQTSKLSMSVTNIAHNTDKMSHTTDVIFLVTKRK